MSMKFTFSIAVATLALVLTACNKTEEPVVTSTTSTSEMEVDVEVEGGEITVMVDGEEQVFVLSEFLGDFEFGNMDGEVIIGVSAFGDDKEDAMRRYHGDNVEFHVLVNGKEAQGMQGNSMQHVMRMFGGEGGDGEHSMQRMRTIKILGGPGMMGGVHGKEGKPHEMHREGRTDRDVPEEVQFMQELGLLSEVARHLDDRDSVAIMGIHMIRDNLDGEIRMAALTTIIEDAPNGSAARNAALFVAIQTLQEGGDNEAAADLMVELVLSN
jgi:hypothetical protein